MRRSCSCEVTRQLEFAFNSAELTDAGKATLDEVAANMGKLKLIEGTVTGYTDSIGNDSYNQHLSERRAQAVVDYLLGHGISAGRLTAVGMGEADPVADNATEAGRAQNRRVVLRRTHCGTN
ncbi:MAG: OmpA family protein [Gammaproteobacteria bacterium]